MADRPNPTTETSYTNFDEDEEIPIPTGLRFMLESLKILTNDPLTTENFLTWSSQIQTIFKANGYTKYLDPNFPIPPQIKTSTHGLAEPNPSYQRWNLINCHLMAAIIATISPSLKPFVLKLETISDVWISLTNRLQSQSISRVIQLRDELQALTLKDRTISQYIAIVKTIVDQSEAAGLHLTNEEIMHYMMNGLPGTYNVFKTAFRLKSERTDLNTFYSLLISEEINLERQNKVEMGLSNMALNTYRGDNRNRSNNSYPIPSKQGGEVAGQMEEILVDGAGHQCPTTPPTINRPMFRAKFARNLGTVQIHAGIAMRSPPILINLRRHT